MIRLKKSYSRDTTLFMQGLWAQGLIHRSQEKCGWQNPFLPLIVHRVNNGVVEIWEHTEAIDWFLQKLLNANVQSVDFLQSLFNEYKGLLQQLQEFHEKTFLTSEEDFQNYRDLIYKAAHDMTLFFYTGVDERNPKAAQDLAVQARKESDFFAVNDVFVRKSIAHVAGISEDLAGVVLPHEISMIPSKDILEKRLESFFLIDGKEEYLGTLQEFKTVRPDYFFDVPQMLKTDDVRGNVAQAGVVRGEVKIVKKQSDISKVKKGDVLVSPMTTPDFLPAMRLASAFVTDEGGVTCHAAIVAREMQKPCITGTSIATEIFKDGDMVEVNANEGVVKILK